ncbi:uncharacterized protein LOC141618067 [Silene latifolia]|uniref:uncharacterized protein LOC141618067 n=1 Tax=Silene latifolia TaxID=37657 RepID=UPI003D77C701
MEKLAIYREYKAYSAVNELNIDAKLSGEKRLLQLYELDEFRLQAYGSSRLYKEKTKRWSGPFTVTNVNKFGSVEVMTINGEKVKGNGHRLKVYHKNLIVGVVEEVIVNPLLMEADKAKVIKSNM